MAAVWRGLLCLIVGVGGGDPYGDVAIPWLDHENAHLRQQIARYARQTARPPLDAKIVPLGKQKRMAIPELNGYRIDAAATFAQTKEMWRQQAGQAKERMETQQTIAWVTREIPPRVQLVDLPPLPIYQGNEEKPALALMFNVAWGTEYVERILRILRIKKVRATFFLDGHWLQKNPVQAQQILHEGHEIGNHAYNHPRMSRLSEDRIAASIDRTERLIAHYLGVKSRFFAPPAGDVDDRVVRMAHQQGLQTILWTIDTIDWHPESSVEKILTRVRNKLQPGGLVLMHPKETTVHALPDIIAQARARGLRIGSVAEVLSPLREIPIA